MNKFKEISSKMSSAYFALALIVIGLYMIFAVLYYRAIGVVFLIAGIVMFIFFILDITAQNHPKGSARIKQTVLIIVIAALILFCISQVIITQSDTTDADMQSPWLIITGISNDNFAVPSIPLADRLSIVPGYIEDCPDCLCVATGSAKEIEFITTWLSEQGVAEENIIAAAPTDNLTDMLSNAFTAIGENTDINSGHGAVITSEYDAFRTNIAISQLGLNAGVISVETSSYIVRINNSITSTFTSWAQVFWG